MADQFVLVVEGLTALSSLDDVPAKILTSARIAVNDMTRKGRTIAARRVLSEVAFPASYVAPSKGRLAVSKFATNNDLEGVITGRTRATSLARFATGGQRPSGAKRKEGVRVEVTPGSTVKLPGAWLIRLRSGTQGNLDIASNMGLAVRTKDGRPPPGYKPMPLGRNVWLLYGPSVAQVLYSQTNNGGVFTDISPEIADQLEREFLRQMDL